VLVALAIVFAGANTWLWVHYYDTRPRTMDVRAGRTIGLNFHGVVVYLTQQEQDWITLLTALSIGSFVSAIIIQIIRTRGKFLEPGGGWPGLEK
jgi:hypothetical protein